VEVYTRSQRGDEALGIVCPMTSNGEDWDPGAAAGQTECLSPAAGGMHIVHTFTYILTSGPPSYSASKGSRMKLLVLSIFAQLLHMSVCDLRGWSCTEVYTHIWIHVVYMCAPSVMAGPGGTELLQPSLSRAFRSSSIYYPSNKNQSR